MSSVLHTTCRAKISNDVILHDQYANKTKDIATRRVTILNLISVVYVQAEKSCNLSKKQYKIDLGLLNCCCKFCVNLS